MELTWIIVAFTLDQPYILLVIFYANLLPSRELDISTDELQVEVRPIRRDENVYGQIFLADKLANGAGYCRHLAEVNEKGELRLKKHTTKHGKSRF